ncbi:phenylacetate--CoA ligase family protein [Chloroflexota bacterium]
MAHIFESEKMSRKDLEKLQVQRLKDKVRQVYERVQFYRDAFKERGITPDDVHSLDDLNKLPFTSKLDFRDSYPYGLMAVSPRDIVRIHASSGTTGKPIVAPYTKGDIKTWSTVMARALNMTGVKKGDILQNAYGYGLFTGGLGVHYGAEKLGASVVPAAAGNTKRQLLLLQDLGTTVICCTPSYAITLSETASEMGINLHNTRLRLGIFGAEPWSEEMRKDIEERLGITALNIYGLTEVMGPGVSMECPYKCGMHVAEDHFLMEIIDSNTGEQLLPGEEGELVITTLSKEAQPVIRFRTKDITRLNHEPCKCGRTLVRMSRIKGRVDDMLKIRGVNVFPSQIESVILTMNGFAPHYMMVVDKKHGFSSTELEIWVEVPEEIFSDDIHKMANLENKLRSEIDSVLGISTRVKLVEPHTIVRSNGKAKRIVDRSEL